MKAISVRPPWAWCIIHMPGPGWKDVENRVRVRKSDGARTAPAGVEHRGPLAIHASTTITIADYEAARTTAAEAVTGGVFFKFPSWAELQTLAGNLIGAVRVFDVSPPGYELDDRPSSPWRHDDHYAFHLSDRVALPARAMPGKLGLFEVSLTPAETAALAAAGLT